MQKLKQGVAVFMVIQTQSDTAMGNQNKIKHHRIPHNSKDLRHQRNLRALNPPDRTGLRNLC